MVSSLLGSTRGFVALAEGCEGHLLSVVVPWWDCTERFAQEDEHTHILFLPAGWYYGASVPQANRSCSQTTCVGVCVLLALSVIEAMPGESPGIASFLVL